jgi:hypothetical protein
MDWGDQREGAMGSTREDCRDLGLEYRGRIATLIRSDSIDVKESVRRYLDPAGPFAAHSFDSIKSNPANRLDVADFLAVGFLDTPIKAASFRELKRREDEISALLEKLPTGRKLWEMTQDEYETGDALWSVLRSIKGLGPTRVSKILARKRPKLFPIWDSRVDAFFEHKTERFWWPLAVALEDRDLRARIRDLKPPDLEDRISLIRVLDIAIWMSGADVPGTVGDDD